MKSFVDVLFSKKLYKRQKKLFESGKIKIEVLYSEALQVSFWNVLRVYLENTVIGRGRSDPILSNEPLTKTVSEHLYHCFRAGIKQMMQGDFEGTLTLWKGFEVSWYTQLLHEAEIIFRCFDLAIEHIEKHFTNYYIQT